MRLRVGTCLLILAALARPTGVLTQPVAAEARRPRSNGHGEVRVEPFRNLRGNPADAWIGDGIAAAVAVDLGGHGAAPRWVVRGAYQRLGAQIRITAALTDAGTGRIIHAVKVDGEVSALFRLQDGLAAQLAVGYGSPVASSRLALAPAPYEGHALVYVGVRLVSNRLTRRLRLDLRARRLTSGKLPSSRNARTV